MKRIEFAVLVGLIVSIIVSSFTAFADSCENVRSEVLRLHILANSDSEADQNLKLSVRDAILERSGPLFDGALTLNAALEMAEINLPQIEEIAREEIAEQGYNYDVRAYICEMYFETRKYEDVTMPAGKYKALRIEIGKAEGKNWWCVIFPTLCIPAAQGNAEINDVFEDQEIDTVTSPKYEAKFAIIELFERIKNRK